MFGTPNYRAYKGIDLKDNSYVTIYIKPVNYVLVRLRKKKSFLGKSKMI